MVAEDRLARRRRAFQLQLLGRTGSEDMEMFHQVERHASLDLPLTHTPSRGLWSGAPPAPSPLGRVPVATAPVVPDLISLDGAPCSAGDPLSSPACSFASITPRLQAQHEQQSSCMQTWHCPSK